MLANPCDGGRCILMFWFCFKDIVIPCNIFHQPCWTGGWKDFETKKRNSINGNASETNIYFGHKSSASEGCECVLIVQFISILHFFVIIVWKKIFFLPFLTKYKETHDFEIFWKLVKTMKTIHTLIGSWSDFFQGFLDFFL